MIIIGQILILLLNIAFWFIMIQVAVSWLIAFEVINTRNPQAARAVYAMDRVTDPIYRPLHRFIPPIAGMDLTPIILILAIYFLKMLVAEVFFFRT